MNMHFFQHFCTDQLRKPLERRGSSLEKWDPGNAVWEEPEQQSEPERNQVFVVECVKDFDYAFIITGNYFKSNHLYTWHSHLNKGLPFNHYAFNPHFCNTFNWIIWIQIWNCSPQEYDHQPPVYNDPLRQWKENQKLHLVEQKIQFIGVSKAISGTCRFSGVFPAAVSIYHLH